MHCSFFGGGAGMVGPTILIIGLLVASPAIITIVATATEDRFILTTGLFVLALLVGRATMVVWP